MDAASPSGRNRVSDQSLCGLGAGESPKGASQAETKMAAVMAFADNKRDPGQTTIAVTAPDIKGCVGVSRRYAYDLLEAIASEVPGCRLRERTTGGGGTAAKPKAVLVDCETVHQAGINVNSFTTRRATTDGGTSVRSTQEESE